MTTILVCTTTTKMGILSFNSLYLPPLAAAERSSDPAIDVSNLSNEYRASLSNEQLNEYKKVKEILIRMNKFCVTSGMYFSLRTLTKLSLTKN